MWFANIFAAYMQIYLQYDLKLTENAINFNICSAILKW